jgi:hypothetical protein
LAAVADKPYFAQHATFPGVQSNVSLNSPDTPWILYGGSLAGAETAIALHEYGGDGGILWAGIASSGTTYATLAYPEWYEKSEKSMTAVIINMSPGMLQSRSMDHRIAWEASTVSSTRWIKSLTLEMLKRSTK